MPLLRYEKSLSALRQRSRLRSLSPRRGIDFSSNDYLALADSAVMRGAVSAALERGVPVGAGASRLLRGNHPEHEALEAEAAAFFGSEAALYYGGGFVANFALLSLLPERDDLVVHDELIHASCREGLKAAAAPSVAARHNDAGAFEDAIRKWRAAGGKGQPWIVVESLYSMDGDCAPLGDLVSIAQRHEAMLMVDEAHATGVTGPGGRGLTAGIAGREYVICVHTCGKALGAMGGLVCAPRAIVDYLVNCSAAFIYATAPSPLMAASVRAALGIVAAHPELRERHARLVARAGRGSHIVPVIIGDSARALAAAEGLQAQGFDVRAIRPPTVPAGTARLRISLTLHATEDDVGRLFAALPA